MFSVLQQFSPWTIEKAKRLKQAEGHMKFMCELYEEQVRAGEMDPTRTPGGSILVEAQHGDQDLEDEGSTNDRGGPMPIWSDDERKGGSDRACPKKDQTHVEL